MKSSPTSYFADIDFLLFKVEKWLFGVDVEQVTQIIRGVDSSKSTIHFEGEELPISPFLAKYKLKGEANSSSMENILVVGAKGRYLALAVDMIDNVLALSPRTHIAPLPPLVKGKKELSCLWGVAKKEDDLILLVNLDQYEE